MSGISMTSIGNSLLCYIEQEVIVELLNIQLQ